MVYLRSIRSRLSPLTFEPVRSRRFPRCALGIAAGEAGGAAPAVFNAANERAVAAFLAGKIAFADIAARNLGRARRAGWDAVGHARAAARRRCCRATTRCRRCSNAEHGSRRSSSSAS